MGRFGIGSGEGMRSWKEQGERALGKEGAGSLTLQSGHRCICRLGKGGNPRPGTRSVYKQVNVVPQQSIRYSRNWKGCLRRASIGK